MQLLFPYIYFALLVPVFTLDSFAEKVWLAGALLVFAMARRWLLVRSVAALFLFSLITLIAFSIVVQTTLCTSLPGDGELSLGQCVVDRAAPILINVTLLLAIFAFAAANELRESLLNTVNGLSLPRTIRMIGVLAGAMIGDFRRATTRVHHAFAARGDASPSFSWRNLLALPKMLGRIWSSVLSLAAERLNHQWATAAFWDLYVPLNASQAGALRSKAADVVATIIVLSGLTLGLIGR